MQGSAPMAGDYMTIDLLQQISQIVAFFSAAIFFIYKVVAGYFVPNVSLAPEISRIERFNSDNDLLIVKVSIKKGDNGSINIHDAKVRLSGDSVYEIVDLTGVQRLSFDSQEINDHDRKAIAWNRISQKNPYLRIGPHEETVFSCMCEVTKNTAINVEVVILGVKPKSCLKSQWRASVISA